MASRLEQALQGYNANVGAQIDSGRMFQQNLKDRLKDLGTEQQDSDENELNLLGMHFFGDKIKSWLSNKLTETVGEKAGELAKNLMKDPAGTIKNIAEDAGEKLMSKAGDVVENLRSTAEDAAQKALQRITETGEVEPGTEMEEIEPQEPSVEEPPTEEAPSVEAPSVEPPTEEAPSVEAPSVEAPRIFGDDDVARAIDNLNISDAGKDLVTRSLDDNDAFRQLYRQRFPDRPELTDEEADEARGATRDSLQSRGERLRQQEPAEETPTEEPPAPQATSSTPELQSGTPEVDPPMARGVGRSVENLESEARPPPRLFQGAPKIQKETTAPPEEPDAPSAETEAPPPVETPPSGLPEGATMEASDAADLEEAFEFL